MLASLFKRSSGPPDVEPQVMPSVMWTTCPIQSSLGVLGRRWSLLILRDVAFFRKVRFSDMLRTNPGLSARVLSIRLKELQREGLIERTVAPDDRREISYAISEKGRDVVPILSAFIQYGSKHRAKEVFPDRRPREFGALFPRDGRYMLGPFYEYARSDRSARARGGAPLPRRSR